MPNPFVRKLEAHASLKSERRHAIDALTSRVDYLDSRENIASEDDEPHTINVVLSGWACHHKGLPDGRRQITALFLPGDICGSDVFLAGSVRKNLSTLTPVILAKVPAAAIRATMTAHPDLAEALWWQMLVAVEIQREWTVNVGRRSALERLAHFFCEIWTRLDTVGIANGAGCEMPMTQNDLADAMGLSSVHVNRSLQELRAIKLIELHDRRLFIPDRRKLAEVAMFDPAYLHRRMA